MSQPGQGGPPPADDSAGDEELYNPITYEQDAPDAWVAGNSGAAGGVPVAGAAGTARPAPKGWAPAGWASGREAPPEPVYPAFPAPPAPEAPAAPEAPQPTFTPRPPEPAPVEEPATAAEPAFEEEAAPAEEPAYVEEPQHFEEPPPPEEPTLTAPRDGGIWPDESWPPRLPGKPRRPRWLLVAVAAVAVVAAAAGTAVALAGGSPGKQPSAASSGGAAPRPSARPEVTFPPGMAPPLTLSAAQGVLTHYTAANNTANAAMSRSLLGGYETAGSQELDASRYAEQRAQGTAAYPAYAPSTAHYYIPVEPTYYPHWFAALVTNQALAGKHQGLGTEYLLFTQSGPGAAWKDKVEPYLLPGAAAPPVALDADGYATAVAFRAPGLAVMPSKLAQTTADSLDGHGPVSDPGNLAETGTVNSARARLATGSTVTDQHTQTAYGIVGLRTAGGGALLFYTDAAIVTFTPPHGKTFTLSIPGFFTSAKHMHWAGLRFLDQLATYDPPTGGGSPRVVADYTGIEKKL